VKALCDAATILRLGRVVAHCDPKAETARSMAEMMVGDEIAWVERKGNSAETGPVRLKIDHLNLPSDSEFGISLNDLSLEVRGGEVVGIAGVAGEGQSELMAALTGEVFSDRAEAILIDGEAMGRADPTRRRLAGAAFVPEERNGHAAVSELTLSENIILPHHTAERVATRSWIDFAKAAAWAKRVRKTFDVRSASENPTAGSLSGGNLQKFIVGREILREPGVLVVSQPTWGVDAGAASVIRRALIDLAARGSAVLVISQDLEEIFSICDKIAVIHHGRLSREHAAAEMTPEKVGLLMGGAHPEDSEIPAGEVA
jgi:simple sugar transport system ATP-binding protein